MVSAFQLIRSSAPLLLSLYPCVVSAVPSPPNAQQALGQEALLDILGRSAPIAGEIETHSRVFSISIDNLKGSIMVAPRVPKHPIGWPKSPTALSLFI